MVLWTQTGTNEKCKACAEHAFWPGLAPWACPLARVVACCGYGEVGSRVSALAKRFSLSSLVSKYCKALHGPILYLYVIDAKPAENVFAAIACVVRVWLSLDLLPFQLNTSNDDACRIINTPLCCTCLLLCTDLLLTTWCLQVQASGCSREWVLPLMSHSAALPTFAWGRADVDRMLARSEPLDLARNVFHNGVWGTLRQTSLPFLLDASVLPPLTH